MSSVAAAYGKIKDIIIANPKKYRLQTIEETGRGNTLCYDFFLGRMIRDDPECIRDICEKYCEMYRDSCEKLDEDPRCMAYEVTSWNDLYDMIGIAESTVGDNFGYTNDQDWRLDVEFEYYYKEKGPLVEKYGEKIFFFGPKDHCQPFECYREV